MVTDEEGLLFGSHPFVWGREQSEPVLFELAETAALDLQVQAERPGTEREEARWRSDYQRVSLEPLDTTSFVGAEWRLRVRKWLPPGGYAVSVASRIHGEEVEEVELVGGAIEHLAVELSLLEERRVVRGTIRTESGAPPATMTVRLGLRDVPKSRWTATLQRNAMCGTGIDHWVELVEGADGEFGRFTFHDVPVGPVSVEADCYSAPSSIEVVEDASGDLSVAIVQLDAGVGPGFGFRVADATGSPAPRYKVYTRPHDGGPPLHENPPSGRILSKEHPASRRLEWAVGANGFKTVFGTQEDFAPEGEGRFFAGVTLEPGWRARVLLVDQDEQPISGAAILVDGEVAGLTHAEGWLEVDRDAAPETIEAQYMNWHPRFGFPKVHAGHRWASPWHVITLIRPGSGGARD